MEGNNKKILFYFGHPSQYLFLKNTIHILREKGTQCDILIKSKDVLEELLIEDNEGYQNILPEGRSSKKLGILRGLIKRDFRLFSFTRNKNYNLFVGTDPSLAHIGFLKRIPVITTLEDDIGVIPKLAAITYPFTSTILVPNGCQTGRFEFKTIHYNGFMKLAYLYPTQFSKTVNGIRKPYFLIRLSKLDAYHDLEYTGLDTKILGDIIKHLSPHGDIYISSEKDIPEIFNKYLVRAKASEMHKFLSNASLLISDSQSMSMEAAILGIPSIRYSGFVGKISVLEELEHSYGLTFGINLLNPEQILKKIDEILSIPDYADVFEARRQILLKDKIDVTSFLVWFIGNYPRSIKLVNEDPDFQLRFK